MSRIWLTLALLSTTHHIMAPYCPPTKRYDVAQFPPRCMDCPEIIPNQMTLTQISTVARTKRASKFSPGLPQNQTCGCWRAPANQTVDVALNASWIVSGLVFNNNRGRWLRQINIHASADNISFLDWGSYTATNYSEASTTIFSYPIRAQFFRITVIRYANHFVNDTSGFPISVTALVSQTQPFDCGCSKLSNGQCCPFVNMTVRNDTCMWCMDPTLISTVMINGCGKCKHGTFEYLGRCLYTRPPNVHNSFQTSTAESNGMFWTVGLNITADTHTEVILFLTHQNSSWSHPCMLSNATIASCRYTNNSQFIPIMMASPSLTSQYLQFDRGRYTLNMTQPVIRSWASCDGISCVGSVGALFLTDLQNTFKSQVVLQPLAFNFEIPNFMATVAGNQDTSLARMEIHYFYKADTWAIRISGLRLRGECLYVRWDAASLWLKYSNTEDGEFKPIDPPPSEWETMHVADSMNLTVLQTTRPVSVVMHDMPAQEQYAGIDVRIAYGFGFDSSPSPGDSEQIIFITAKSPQPIRLKRLAVVSLSHGVTTTYTTSKGFIIDSTRVFDLTTGCSLPQDNLRQWITQAVSILADSPPPILDAFLKTSCSSVKDNRVSKAYWLIPSRAPTPRTASYQMEVLAEFS